MPTHLKVHGISISKTAAIFTFAFRKVASAVSHGFLEYSSFPECMLRPLDGVFLNREILSGSLACLCDICTNSLYHVCSPDEIIPESADALDVITAHMSVYREI